MPIKREAQTLTILQNLGPACTAALAQGVDVNLLLQSGVFLDKAHLEASLQGILHYEDDPEKEVYRLEKVLTLRYAVYKRAKQQWLSSIEEFRAALHAHKITKSNKGENHASD